jgi:signal transduction histidine kinase
MAAFLKRWRLNASPVRTFGEMLLVGGLLTLFSLLVYGLEAGYLFNSVFLMFINPSCALYFALRLCIPKGSWLRQAATELFLIGTVSATLYTLILYGLIPLVRSDMLTATEFAVQLLIAAFIAFPFAFFRSVARFLYWWGGLRRRRLIWSLVNSHLVAMALLQAVVALPLILLFILANDTIYFTGVVPDNPISQFAKRVLIGLPLLGIAILGATTMLIALLPASALVSYFFARRIRRRLDALIGAARAAGNGDYSARVPVTGEDEVARLQADFNVMAANLEATVRDLKEERETVQTLLKSRREMMASVSHELRTPVATVRAYLDAAPRHNGSLVLTEGETAILERELDRLQTLIDDLFALSRAEVDQLAFRIALVDAAALIKRVVATVAPTAWRINHVEVLAEVPDSMPPFLGDTNRLEQSLRNLLHNSLRHTPPGGVVVVSLRNLDNRAVIEVRDTGEGIAPNDLPHIWQRYYRNQENGGSGLGLTLVKTFTEAMGGQVSVESSPGDGTCFSLRFPLALPLPDCDNFATNSR